MPSPLLSEMVGWMDRYIELFQRGSLEQHIQLHREGKELHQRLRREAEGHSENEFNGA